MLTTIPKTWGREQWLENNELYCLKELHIFAGQRCSLHRHRVKDETFVVRQGVVIVELRKRILIVNPDDKIRIKPGEWHRFGSKAGAVMLEVSTHHDDSDVERMPGEESGRIPSGWGVVAKSPRSRKGALTCKS